MRLFIMATLMGIGLGLAAMSGAFAAPMNANSIGKSASEMSSLATVQYRRYYYRHRYYRRHYRPYYYGYGYGYPYGPYYYGYPYRPYYGYPYRRWWW